MTSVKLFNGVIYINVGSADLMSNHWLTARNLSVRRWDKLTGQFIVPAEISHEVIRRFRELKDVEIDPAVHELANNHHHLIANKFKLLPTPEEESLIKTSSMYHQRVWLGFARHFNAVANLSEQGTGKSKMALDWATIKGLDSILLIVRNSNVYKWAAEIKQHSDYKPFVLKGTKQERVEKLADAVSYEYGSVACIINYDYVDVMLPYLKKLSWEGIILDESTAIKSVTSKRHKAVVELGQSCKHRLILTGTPLVNSPVDGFGQFRFLNPNVLGTNYQSFKTRYVEFGGFRGYQVLGYKNLEELTEKIYSFSFRVLKRDCLDLPPKIFEKYEVEPSEEFKKRYNDLVNATMLELGDTTLDNTMAISKINRCLQLCDGFLYSDSEHGIYTTYGTPKTAELIDFVDDHFQSSTKLIIWAHFKASIREMHNLLSGKFPDIQFDSVTGETPVINRQLLINAFNDSHIQNKRGRCLILQTASMMHGIDIRCDTCVYYSLSWSNEEWQQSQDRIHGINRGTDVSSTYVILTIPGTVEESVYKALQRKIAISKVILKDAKTFKDALKGELGE